jgi:hypothetical protein
MRVPIGREKSIFTEPVCSGMSLLYRNVKKKGDVGQFRQGTITSVRAEISPRIFINKQNDLCTYLQVQQHPRYILLEIVSLW